MTPEHTEAAKTATDLAASFGALVATLGHWANTLTPILTLLIAVASLGWWIIRYAEWWGKRKRSDDEGA